MNKKKALMAGLLAFASTSSYSAFEMIAESIQESRPVATSIAAPSIATPVAPVVRSAPKVVDIFNKEVAEAKYRRLSFSGVSVGVQGMSVSSGKDMPLRVGANLFTPNGWKFLVETGVMDSKVSWSNSDYWLHSMNEIATQTGSFFHIDWNQKTITASEHPASYNFTLKQGESLSEELARWAILAGWNFMWELDYDIVIESGATFKGTFPEAFYNTVRAYQRNGAMLDVSPEASAYNKAARLKVFKEAR